MNTETAMDPIKLVEEIQVLKWRNEKFQKQLNAAHAGLLAVKDMIQNSTGITRSGLGTVPWSDLRTGGIMEDWLMEFDFALVQAEECPATLEKRSENASKG